MENIRKPSQKWKEYKKEKTLRDLQLQAWRDGAIIILIMILGMIEL